MEKLFSLILLALFTVSCASLTPEEKAQQEAKDQLKHELAVQSLNNQTFVLEADKITFKRGRNVYVSPGTNFIMMNSDQATVQVAFNSSFAGPNGIGGITLDGMVGNIKSQTSKKGEIRYSFNVQGVGISSQVELVMFEGSNFATVTINPNFSSNRITLTGYVVPLEESNVYKGRSI